MHKLVLFSEVFPYHGRETFLEVEIQYLSKRFDRIIVVPFRSNKGGIRTVPENCEVVEAVTSTKWGMYFFLLLPSRAFPYFFKDFWRKKVYTNYRRFKTWLIAFAMTNSYLHNYSIKKIFNCATSSDVFYSYWGKGGCFLAPFFAERGIFVSRFHGEWDLWEERCGNYGPIRQEVISNLKVVFPISNKGASYLKDRYDLNEVVVSRLGTKYHGKSFRSQDDSFRIVSCSTVNANKRVLFMLEAFSAANFPIEWTHIGIGPDFETLQKKVQTVTNPLLKVSIKGRLSNNEVFDYYINNPVDCFINLSQSEGIPVSIMEAISCDIPIIATNVGSTSEIMTKETGVLLSSNPSIEDVINAIQTIKAGNYSPFDFWNQTYNAEKNYNSFIDVLMNL